MLDSDGPPVHAIIDIRHVSYIYDAIQPKPILHTIMFGILLQKNAWV